MHSYHAWYQTTNASATINYFKSISFPLSSNFQDVECRHPWTKVKGILQPSIHIETKRMHRFEAKTLLERQIMQSILST